MSAIATDVTLVTTSTTVFGPTTIEGDAILFVKNNGAQPVSLNLYYYPDGVTPVADASIAIDLTSIPAGRSVLSPLKAGRVPMISMDGTASSGSQSVHVEVIQPPIRRARVQKRTIA